MLVDIAKWNSDISWEKLKDKHCWICNKKETLVNIIVVAVGPTRHGPHSWFMIATIQSGAMCGTW